MTEAKKHPHNSNNRTNNTGTTSSLNKELDDSLCPICMDHPHNAVLLICSSRDKGCSCYVCDTSYRHSNCLDRFKKLLQNDQNAPDENAPNNTLKCPLCRGDVLRWMVVEDSRKYLDQKVKCCSRESCGFFGNYRELRRHARRAHPSTRPGAVDPSRQRSWNRLEQRQEYGDVLSAIRSAIPGAVVFGDYVIEMGDETQSRVSRVRGRDEGNDAWWTPFVLFQTRRDQQHQQVEDRERFLRRRRRRFVRSRSYNGR